jgi:Holliday junction resolvase
VVNKKKIKGTQWENQFVELIIKNIPLTISAKRVVGSGAMGTAMNEPLLKGDVVANFYGFPRKFRIETKVGYGGDTQLTVKKEWINKIIEEANETYSYPVVACKFSGARKSDGVQYFIILDFNTFCDIINYANNLKKELDLLYEKLEKEDE